MWTNLVNIVTFSKIWNIVYAGHGMLLVVEVNRSEVIPKENKAISRHRALEEVTLFSVTAIFNCDTVL